MRPFIVLMLAFAPTGLHAEEARRIDFKDLIFTVPEGKTLDLDLHIPLHVRQLEGKVVRLRGYIHPSVLSDDGIESFLFMDRDSQPRTFGQHISLDRWIFVSTKEGEGITFTTKEIEIKGEFGLEVIHDGNREVSCVYRMRNARVVKKR